MYNRGVRAYKMVCEAIVRKNFEEIGVNDDGNVLDFDITNKKHSTKYGRMKP